MTPVVLVHGAWHRGASWAAVVRELAARGCVAAAVDLPADVPGAALLDHVLAIEDVVAAVCRPAEPVVLVGHSLGGLAVPVVAQRLGHERVAAMVLVAALIPQPGVSFRDQTRADPGIMVEGFGAGQRRHDDGTTSWPGDVAAGALYPGLDPDAAEEAVAQLRPQAWGLHRDVSPLTGWPAVPTTVVICGDDHVVAADRQRTRAAAIPGAQVIELRGGHFPMLTRPGELAEIIAGVARS